MNLSLGEWSKDCSPDALAEIADLWNANAQQRHAFYPWTGKLLADLITRKNVCVGTLLEARIDGGLIGFCHAGLVTEEGYPCAGTVDALLIDAAHRGRGYGTALLQAALASLENRRPRPGFIDAMGAWPFGYAFNVLADGSERSGVFLTEPELYRLFRRAGFEPVRKSYVMRADARNPQARPRPLPYGADFYIHKRLERTWLDRVFRGRELWDYELVKADGRILSRAIFGLMDGESRQEGKIVFSLFGVNTPVELRGRGYAKMNLSHLLAHVASLGCDAVELHVYADNPPALAAYRSLGFREIAETMMMHKFI